MSGQTLQDALPKLAAAAQTLPLGAAGDTMRANAEFQGKSGMQPKIVRTYRRGKHACEWCAALAGTYKYPDVPDDVYHRHANCRCSVEYSTGKGMRSQNVWTKQERTLDEQEQITARKEMSETPISRDVRVVESPKNEPENVLSEYMKNAKPGVGSITYDDGYDVVRHAPEIKTAQWLHENLGGDIVLLNESNVDGELRPDYVWREKMWDLKTASSEKSANSSVRHGLKQISNNPGGLLIDFENRKVSIEELKRVIGKRMLFSTYQGNVDILVTSKKELICALRYKKR